MPGGYGLELDYILQMLVSSMEPVDGKEPRDGLVFLLGAGCSRQYGLPNFKELLSYIREDCFQHPADALGDFQALRDELEKYWQAQGPESRHRILLRHLGRNQSVCPAYYRLATLAKDGYVKAIVNMNFDNLLERELAKVLGGYQKFKISTSFRVGNEPDNPSLMVYKPHGSTGTIGTRNELDQLVSIAETVITIATSYKQVAKEMITDMAFRLGALHKDICWTPNEVLTSAKELVRAALSLVRNPEKLQTAGTEIIDQMRLALRSIEQARLNPLWTKNDLILDIANSDLFADPEEQIAAQELLTSHDVVSIGYSGVDAKIAAALRTFKSGKDPRDRKLYFVNLDPPDPRIFLVLAERASQNLCVTGEDAAFENFMEHLQVMLEERKARSSKPKSTRPQRRGYRAPDNRHLLTRAESIALGECLRLAMSIRSAINVGDRSSISIEEHGNELYWNCVRLADIAGICLTSPEKYLLHCAAFLHDLGYFSAYSRANLLTGLALLKRHGEITSDLLQQRFEDDTDLGNRIVPASYQGKGRELFREMLLFLCRYHPVYEPPAEAWPEAVLVDVYDVEVPINLRLLHALFSAAEHIVKEHPFLPSSDPVVDRDESAPAIEDPVLDLYLRRQQTEVTYRLKRRIVEGRLTRKLESSPPSKRAEWLFSMTAMFVRRLNPEFAGWPVEFVCAEKLTDPKVDEEDSQHFKDLLREALEEELQRSLDQVQRLAKADVVQLLVEAEKLLVESCEPGSPLEEVPEPLQQDLRLIVSLVAVWVTAVRTQILENWIQDMGETLKLADQWLQGLLPGSVSAELRLAAEAVRKGIVYYEVNAPHASTHAAVNTLDAARKVLDWVAKREVLSDEVNSLFITLIRLLAQFGHCIDECSVGEVISTLDLLAIYTLPVDNGEPATVDPKAEGLRLEPRVRLDRESVRIALGRIREARRLPHQGLLHLYFSLKQQSSGFGSHGASPLESAFLRCYEEILHPSWRFFARNWHDRSEPLLMARACLDLGSSRFRPEVAGGTKYLLGEKVEWETRSASGMEGDFAFGHDECTLCTSRLLYVLCSVKRLFPASELKKLSNNLRRKGVDETVAALLRYLLSRPAKDPAWWGLGTEKDLKNRVRSADYLAWAARAVAFCRSVDQEILERTGQSWLEKTCGITRKSINELLRQRREQLLEINKDDLLSGSAEEPVTFTLGRVALAYLDLQRMEESGQEVFPLRETSRQAKSFTDELRKAMDEIWRDNLAQMSRFYLLPVLLVLDTTLETDDLKAESAERIVDLCLTCINSRIWIRTGSDSGSWGFNVKNTQALVTALMAFWRYAFDPENVDRFQEAFKEADSKR
jgi:hypothetical protein